MKCPECEQVDETSKVFYAEAPKDGECWVRLVSGYGPFYDEHGRRHLHDLGYTQPTFKCSKGHTFTGREPIGLDCPMCKP